jgi:protein-disulfide isomerase
MLLRSGKKETILKKIALPSKFALGLFPASALTLVLGLSAAHAFGQAAAAVPAAPAPQTPAAAAPQAPIAGPASLGPVPDDPLPKANPRNFTAASPTLDTVNSFLHQVWGHDENRLYRVMAIQPTAAPNVTRVVVFVKERGTDAKVQAATFFVTPDGKHAIGDGSIVVPFGATPFADTRDTLRAHADGAYRGADSKDLELVEFADLQCPHCRDAQTTIDQIVKDFPKARVVFQPFPLVESHPSAFKAAAYGVCVQQKSNEDFFKFATGVFDTQDALAPATEDTLLKAAAKRAGLDADAIAACAATPTTRDIVNADIKLGTDVGVDQTPLLSVNGRMLPLGGSISYEQIKQLIQFQATLDGVDSGATAETLAPKPVVPTLQTLPK